jgi:CRP-like cAMP-binding protein
MNHETSKSTLAAQAPPSTTTQRSYRNGLLRRLSAQDFALLEPHLRRIPLTLKMPLVEPGVPIEAVYFVEQGIASVVAGTSSKHEAEIGFIGYEGMAGYPLIMNDDRSPQACYVQLEGEAMRMDAASFSAALAASPTLRLFLLRFVNFLQTQTGCTALVNARLRLGNRLARWLLMCDDRVIGDRFSITHEFIATMLGVRRPGVTVALQELEGLGLIRSRRSEITILDRAGLIALTSGEYGIPEAEYIRLLGDAPPATDN